MRGVSLLLACLILVGCEASPTVLPLKVSATASRFDEGQPRLSVALRNTSSKPMHIRQVRLSWPGLSGPWVDLDRDIAADDAIAFKATYDEGFCVQARGTPTLLVDTGRQAARLPMSLQPDDLLTQISARNCALAALRKAATLTLLPGRLEGASYRAAVLVRRLPGSSASVRVIDVGGSVLLRMSMRSLPARVGAATRLPLTISPAPRCDPHAQSQSSQTFLMSVYLEVNGTPVRSILQLSPAVKADLQRMITRACRG